MTITNRKGQLLLFIGDIILFSFALWLSLVIRNLSLPSIDVFYNHLAPFSFLFVAWILVFFIAGLYDKHTMLFQHDLPHIIFRALVANVIIAALFFFLVPYFDIAPKTILAIYLLITFALIVLWRLHIFPLFRSSRRHGAIVIGTGKETKELVDEVNNNRRYPFEFVLTVDLAQVTDPNDISKTVLRHTGPGNASVIVCNTRSDKVESLLPLFYNLSFLHNHFHFVDINKMYEEIFERVPLSQLRYDWFLNNISTTPHEFYDALKRLMDMAIAMVLGLFALIIYPFVYLAVKLEDGGPVLIQQERIGHHNENITVHKFRTMSTMEDGVWIGESANRVTRVGAFLRSTSIDELPQVWDVLRGNLSFIGPRSDLSQLGARLAETIPHYSMRYAIKPGISGWAQINQKYEPGNISPQSIEESKMRLAYDLYYVKNRSFILDLKIALKTLRVMFTRAWQ